MSEDRNFDQSANELFQLRQRRAEQKQQQQQKHQIQKTVASKIHAPTKTITEQEQEQENDQSHEILDNALDRNFNDASSQLNQLRQQRKRKRPSASSSSSSSSHVEPDCDFLQIEQELANYRLIKAMQKLSSSSNAEHGFEFDRDFNTALIEITNYRKQHPPRQANSDARDFYRAEQELAQLRQERRLNQNSKPSSTTSATPPQAYIEESQSVDRDYTLASVNITSIRKTPRKPTPTFVQPDSDFYVMEKELAKYRLIKAMQKQASTYSSVSSSSGEGEIDRDYIVAESEFQSLQSIATTDLTTPTKPTTTSIEPDSDFIQIEKELATFRFIKAIQKFDKQRFLQQPSPEIEGLDRNYNSAQVELANHRSQHSKQSPLDRNIFTAEAELVEFRRQKKAAQTKLVPTNTTTVLSEQQVNKPSKPSPIVCVTVVTPETTTPPTLIMVGSTKDTTAIEVIAVAPTPHSYSDRDFMIAERELFHLRSIR